MPDYFTHMAFSKKISERIDIKDMNRFLVSSLIPDICKQDDDIKKEKCHFIPKRLDRTFKNPNLLYFFTSYKDFLYDEATLGIYSHLYLDKYYYLNFLPSIFEINGEYMTNRKNGNIFLTWEEFFVPNGIYKEYTAMNKFFVRDYELKLNELDFDVENLPPIKEFDYSKLPNAKIKMLNFYSEEGRYTGEYIKYEEITDFIEELADKFTNYLIEL